MQEVIEILAKFNILSPINTLILVGSWFFIRSMVLDRIKKLEEWTSNPERVKPQRVEEISELLNEMRIQVAVNTQRIIALEDYESEGKFRGPFPMRRDYDGPERRHDRKDHHGQERRQPRS